jgi:hypothetical protein
MSNQTTEEDFESQTVLKVHGESVWSRVNQKAARPKTGGRHKTHYQRGQGAS